MKSKSKRSSKSTPPPQSYTISTVIENRLKQVNAIYSNFYSTIALYVFLIFDSLIKMEIEMRKGINQDKYLFYVIQLSLYSSLLIFFLGLEICFKNRKTTVLNDTFFFLSSIIVSVSILEERIANAQMNETIIHEGCKITLIQFLWIPNFQSEKSFLFANFANLIYLVARIQHYLTENVISLFAFSAIFAFQIIKIKPSMLSKGKFIRDNNNTRKNMTTFIEENELESADFNYLFENLLNHASDGFILFDDRMEIIFHNRSILNLFPDLTEDLKNGLLSLKLNNFDNALQKLLDDSRPKSKKPMDLQNIFQLKVGSNILSSMSSYDEMKPNPQNITLLDILGLLNMSRYSTFRQSLNKLIKVKDYGFGFKTSNYNENNPYNMCVGGLSVFCYRSRKIYLVCFKKEMLANKILDNFQKVIDYISIELTNALNTTMILLQMLQTSNEMPKKLTFEYVDPAMTSMKFLINLKNEMANIGDMLRGKIVKNLIEFNLKELAMEVLGMFSFQCDSKSINLSLKYDERIPKVIKSDPRIIGQILTTLISMLF